MSLGKYICPIYVAGARKLIKFDEVGYDLPLLISLDLAKSMDLRISFKHDTAHLPSGEQFKLHIAKGHYWMSVGKKASVDDILIRRKMVQY